MRHVMAFSILVMLAASHLAQPSAKAQVNSAAKEGSGQPVFMPAAGLKWTDLDPKGAPGVKVANLWGGPYQGGLWRLV